MNVMPDVHDCVNAARRIRRRSFYPPYYEQLESHLEPNIMDPPKFNSTEVEPCMVCEPTKVFCPEGCGPLITDFLSACQGECLPDTYFFDPYKTMPGCYDSHTFEITRHLERCGCSSASKLISIVTPIIITIVATITLSWF